MTNNDTPAPPPAPGPETPADVLRPTHRRVTEAEAFILVTLAENQTVPRSDEDPPPVYKVAQMAARVARAYLASLPPPPPADELPIEQVRAELAEMGIDTGTAVQKVQDAVRRKEADDAVRLAAQLVRKAPHLDLAEDKDMRPIGDLMRDAAAELRRLAGRRGA